MSETLPPLGFIAVDVHFHRPRGDPFNEQTWPFPLIREQAEGSTEAQIVTNDEYDAEFIERFVDAGLRLAARGCVGIITSCGFLAMAQPKLASRLPIPIATSALMQIPSVLSILPPTKAVAILTYDAARLGKLHLQQLGINTNIMDRFLIRGAPQGGHLQSMIARGAPYVHSDIEAELVQLATDTINENAHVGAIALECTQMPPFAEAIQRVVGSSVPVFDAYTMGCWFYSGLVRRRPVAWGEV